MHIRLTHILWVSEEKDRESACVCAFGQLQRHFKPVTWFNTAKYTFNIEYSSFIYLISDSLFYYLIVHFLSLISSLYTFSFALFGSFESFVYVGIVIYVKLVGLLRWRVDRCLSIKSLCFFFLFSHEKKPEQEPYKEQRMKKVAID